MSDQQYMQSAWITGTRKGWVALNHEWHGEGLPPLSLEGCDSAKLHWYPLGEVETAKWCGCFWKEDRVTFVLPHAYVREQVGQVKEVYVAGSLNGWAEAIGQQEWKLGRRQKEGEEVWSLTIENPLWDRDFVDFKFVTGDGIWISPPWESPVRVEDEESNANFRLDRQRKYRFMYGFEYAEPLPLGEKLTVLWKEEHHHEGLPLHPGHFFLQMGNDLPLGALYSKTSTIFRVFAPRARKVILVVGHNLDRSDWREHEMTMEEGGTWSVEVTGDWAGAFYGYHVHGKRSSKWTHFNAEHLVLDPYALAVVSRDGPGIVVPHPPKVAPHERFIPANWHDLIILEVHLADLLNRDPANHHTAPSYLALAHRMKDPHSYLASTPVNAVEFQPLQQNDGVSVSDYHWGYMPVNYFAPHSGYCSDPTRGGVIGEFREMVKSLHRNGKAVIMDVVYNHYGEPNHLLYLDKTYYFRLTQEGELFNYSGCGNDLRTESRMTRRLILDSLRYWVEVFDVDGFRFDLAELIGKSVLLEIERELKKIKPSIVLIAEPWSFRGHIASELRNTGLASWNDGYRENIYEYLCGRGSLDSLQYFLTGSPGDFACWPAQSVNYLESHDDYTLLDRLTENEDHDGSNPTVNDRRRIHLGIALLMMSIGIPMFAEGGDFLRSKQGKHNTYQDEETNALDYQRWGRFSATSRYFSDWCRWRLSGDGKLLRAADPIPENFWQFFGEETGLAVAVVYNRERQFGHKRLLFAINPNLHATEIPVEGWNWGSSRLIADSERVDPRGLIGAQVEIGHNGPILPSLSCALWSE